MEIFILCNFREYVNLTANYIRCNIQFSSMFYEFGFLIININMKYIYYISNLFENS